MSPKIAIVGAGPAGLTLGRILTLNSIDVTIYEGEESRHARSQGGTLDLHDDSGLKAIRAGELYHEFLKIGRYDDDITVIADKKDKVYLDTAVLGPGRPKDGEPNGQLAPPGQSEGKPDDLKRPEVDREKLRELLLDSVPEGLIQWGRALTKVEDDGTLIFAHGKEGPFDLVVGADGAFSHVRPLVTDVRPTFSGISGFEFRHKLKDGKVPYPYKVEKGSYFTMSDEKAIMAQRLGDGTLKVNAWGKHTPSYSKEILAAYKGEELRAKVLEPYADWNPEVTNLLKYADTDDVRPWSLYELPVDHKWDHRKGFTLVGDAAHLMTPFAGEGVNTAMLDSYELAQAIIAGKDGDLDAEVEKYEKGMFPRAGGMTAKTMMNKTHMFNKDAPITFMKFLGERIAQAYKEHGREDLLRKLSLQPEEQAV